MKYLPIQLAITLISLTTAFGVFIHDSSIDSALSVTKASSLHHYDAGLAHAGDHIHPSSVVKTLMHGFSYYSVPPRDNRHKRHINDGSEPRGRRAFDSCYLPIIG